MALYVVVYVKLIETESLERLPEFFHDIELKSLSYLVGIHLYGSETKSR